MQETSPEDIQALLSSDFTVLSTTQQQINDVRTQTLRLATAAYDKVDDSIQALDWDIGMLEPQMAASAAEDNSLDPQILAIKRKEQRKVRKGGRKGWGEGEFKYLLCLCSISLTSSIPLSHPGSASRKATREGNGL
jgi:hypothetical protein